MTTFISIWKLKVEKRNCKKIINQDDIKNNNEYIEQFYSIFTFMSFVAQPTGRRKKYSQNIC